MERIPPPPRQVPIVPRPKEENIQYQFFSGTRIPPRRGWMSVLFVDDLMRGDSRGDGRLATATRYRLPQKVMKNCP